MGGQVAVRSTPLPNGWLRAARWPHSGLKSLGESQQFVIVFVQVNSCPQRLTHLVGGGVVQLDTVVLRVVEVDATGDAMGDRAFYHRLQEEGLKIDRTVTHGIACSVYFYDPEDNRIELYYTTPYQVRQPLGAAIDLDKDNDELLAFAQAFEATMGPPRGAQPSVG